MNRSLVCSFKHLYNLLENECVVFFNKTECPSGLKKYFWLYDSKTSTTIHWILSML